MQFPGTVIVAIVGATLFYVLLPVVLEAFVRYRGRKPLVCPETGAGADVAVDPLRAAAGSAFGRRALHVTSCSLWPEQEGCVRGCLESLERPALGSRTS